MANKISTVHKYHVEFDCIFKTEEPIPDISFISVDVFAKNIKEAMDKAWDAVSVSPDDYEVAMIESTTRRISSPRCRF